MKSGEVLKILKISRPTLTKYLHQGKIKAVKLDTGHYLYDDESVYSLINQGIKRKSVVYARVSTSTQKKDLNNQIEILKQFMFSQGVTVDAVYKDIASGISFESRKDFFDMLDQILDQKIAKVYITYKDRLSRVGFGLFKHLFSKYGCEIVVMSEVGSEKLDSEEMFEEIVSLLHCYSMKLYSKRRINNIKKVLEENDESL